MSDRIAWTLGAITLLTSSLSQAQQQVAPTEPAPLQPPAAVQGPYPTEPTPAAPAVIDSTAPAPAYAAAPPPAYAPPPPAEEKGLLDRLGVGKGNAYFQPQLTLQVWYVVSKPEVAAGADSQPADSTFRLRRAEFKVKGEIVPKLVGYGVMFDVAKTTPFAAANVNVTGGGGGAVSVQQPGADRSVLQDLWITFLTDYADISLGQFKIPVSLEALQPATRLLFPERSRVSRFFGDRRDVGVRIEKKIGDYFYYQAGLYNGNALNTTDNDREKDVALRLELYPIKPLTIGAVGYTTLGERDQNARDRLEADLRWDADGLYVEGEFHHGWDGTPGGANRRESQGLHAEAGYAIADKFQPVVRVGFLDPNIDAEAVPADSKLNFFEGGFNYLLSGYEARIGIGASYYSQKRAPDLFEATVQFQASY